MNCYNCFFLSEKEYPPFVQCSRDSMREIDEEGCPDYIAFDNPKHYQEHCEEIRSHLREVIKIALNHRCKLGQQLISFQGGKE